MARFGDLSVRGKMACIVVCLAPIIMSIANCAYDVERAYKAMTKDVAVFAEVTAKIMGAALSFDDSDAANEVLNSLEGSSLIVAAAIYKSNGMVFAKYIRGQESSTSIPGIPANTDRSELHLDRYELYKQSSYNLDGEQIATLYLQCSIYNFLQALLPGFILNLILLLLVIAVEIWALSEILREEAANEAKRDI